MENHLYSIVKKTYHYFTRKPFTKIPQIRPHQKLIHFCPLQPPYPMSCPHHIANLFNLKHLSNRRTHFNARLQISLTPHKVESTFQTQLWHRQPTLARIVEIKQIKFISSSTLKRRNHFVYIRALNIFYWKFQFLKTVLRRTISKPRFEIQDSHYKNQGQHTGPIHAYPKKYNSDYHMHNKNVNLSLPFICPI